jgi:hypothetical protein
MGMYFFSGKTFSTGRAHPAAEASPRARLTAVFDQTVTRAGRLQLSGEQTAAALYKVGGALRQTPE